MQVSASSRPVFDSALSLIAAVAAPITGLFLRASRRARLRGRVREYLALADEIEPHDSKAAAEFRRLASHAAGLLIARDDKWFGRRFEPVTIVALMLFLAPAVVAIIFAWDWDSWARIPLIIAAVIWAVMWTIAAITQLFPEKETP